jgi:4-hydroxythreonine-4-phosphate dehydrogenase
MSDERVIAVTMGDPTGVGPEIIAKVFADARAPRAVVVGDVTMMRRAVRLLGLPLEVRAVGDVAGARLEPGVIDVLGVTDLPEDLPFGRVDPRGGESAFRALERAVQLALAGEVHAVATAPLNKEALHRAGFEYPGHTEILAELTGVRDYAMMLVADRLRVVHVSTHVALSEAIRRVQPERERTVIRLADRSLRRLGVEHPRVAVAGLNPHAGEAGLFGTEDRDVIAPAVEAARAEGIDASGPWSPDTVFMQARQGRFDVVVVQYHDQGHIPIKLMGVGEGVNVTVGLPFFRTSVDHGTAFDIAGTGKADPGSLRAALDLAATLERGGY